MDKKDVQDWSRHLDTLMWGVTTLLGGGNGALLVYSSSQSSFDAWFCAMGIFLTVLMAYFVASFRAQRRIFHDLLAEKDEETFAYARNPSQLKQWPAFMLVIALFLGSWFRLLDINIQRWRCCWILGAILCFALCAAFMIWAERSKKKGISNSACSSRPPLET